jgi:glycosyltransferase involved in cell wall biosynthesis
VTVALVHDYLTQRGGAERVVLSMLKAFPDAPLYTSLYRPETTFPEFDEADVRTLALNRIGVLRREHRLALPLLAPAFSRLRVPAEVVLCSSSGWAHGVRTRGRKIVYCHNPARWLYQADEYVRPEPLAVRAIATVIRPALMRWDRRAARGARRYLANSKTVQRRIRAAYGLEAEVLPPPHRIDPNGPQRAIPGLDPGFFLCVTRLLPYKNVTAVVSAFARLLEERLAIVGVGPDEPRVRAAAGPNVRLLGAVADEELRWLYANSRAIVAAAHEDYGLTPLEAAAFGKPAIVLRAGGFLDTVDEGRTGHFFEEAEPDAIAEAVREASRIVWDEARLQMHAARFSESAFVARLRSIVAEEAEQR